MAAHFEIDDSAEKLGDSESLAEFLLDGRKHLRGPFKTPFWAPHVNRIYARRYTLAAENKVAHLVERNDQTAYAQIVVRHARNFDDTLIFKISHAHALSVGDASENVRQVALWIMGKLDDDGNEVETPTVEHAAGN